MILVLVLVLLLLLIIIIIIISILLVVIIITRMIGEPEQVRVLRDLLGRRGGEFPQDHGPLQGLGGLQGQAPL